MPLSVNVGLSRKASENFQSTGTSINIVAELDQSLLARPVELQQQIDDLYAQAEAALDRQSSPRVPRSPAVTWARNGHPPAARPTGAVRRANGNGGGYRNGNRVALATVSQKRAIYGIANRLETDAAQEAHDLFAAAVDDLTIQQASQLIDALKARIPAQDAEGAVN